MQSAMAVALATLPISGWDRVRPSAQARAKAARSWIPAVRRGRSAESARVCPRGSGMITMSADGAGWLWIVNENVKLALHYDTQGCHYGRASER